jgi:lysophospholipase L1-like esterase
MKKIIGAVLFLTVHFSLPAQVILDTNIHRILFLGNSITYAGNYITDIEAFIITHHPQQHIEFINMGLPSETVSGLSEEGHAGGQFPRPDLHERLERVLTLTKPDLVFACYGMNDGIYLPYYDSRFQKYKDGITFLHDMVAKTGTKIVHLTPPIYDELKGKTIGYSHTLDKYADWLIRQKRKAHWEVADLHYPMKKFLEAHRKVDAAFHIAGFALAEDGVHPNEVGHWMMAKSILLYLGEKDASNAADIKEALALNKNGNGILNLVAQRQLFMKDAWLTAAGHKRPGMNAGLPMEEARLKAMEIETQIQSLNK